MGVKGLWSILEPVSKPCNMDELTGKTVAIDLGFWVCQTNNFEARSLYLRNLLYRTLGLLANNVNLIFVLEGKVPELKLETMKYRFEHRKSACGNEYTPSQGGGRSNFDRVLQECRKMLEMLGVCCVTSSEEAEALCAQLNLHGVVDGCVTDDSDVFLYGAQVVYRNFSVHKNGEMDKYSMSEIQSELKLDRHKLVSLAIILGCDYLPKGIPGVGKEKALKFLRNNPSMNILHRFRRWKDPEFSKDIDRRKEQLKSLKHCTKCEHLGSRRKHNGQGCSSCRSGVGCLDDGSGATCLCDWHRNPVTEAEELELMIRTQALKVHNFPCTQVSQEFLDYNDSWPDDIRHRQRPQYLNMLDFINRRFRWEYEKFFQKVSPVLLAWDLYCLETNDRSDYFFKPIRVVSKAIRKSGVHYEVQWEIHDPVIKLPSDGYAVLSLVKEALLQRILPTLVEKYEACVTSSSCSSSSSLAQRRKRKSEDCEENEQTKMTDFFKQAKPMKPDAKHLPVVIDLTKQKLPIVEKTIRKHF